MLRAQGHWLRPVANSGDKLQFVPDTGCVVTGNHANAFSQVRPSPPAGQLAKYNAELANFSGPGHPGHRNQGSDSSV